MIIELLMPIRRWLCLNLQDKTVVLKHKSASFYSSFSSLLPETFSMVLETRNTSPPPPFFRTHLRPPHLNIVLWAGWEKESEERTGLVDPDRDPHKAVIYIHRDSVCTNAGSCFHARFFLFNREEEEGAVVAKGQQIEWSCGSSLGYADQTAARQAEWTAECLSSCTALSAQWKATHLVGGPLGRDISNLTLVNHLK